MAVPCARLAQEHVDRLKTQPCAVLFASSMDKLSEACEAPIPGRTTAVELKAKRAAWTAGLTFYCADP
jgi:hypothetical protein